MESKNVNLAPRNDITLRTLLRPLNKFLDDENVTELGINRPGEVITKTFKGWEHHSLPELSASYLHSLANAVIVYNGIQTKSRVSVRYPDGQRGEIVMPPAVIDGMIAFTIRKHSLVVKTTKELENEGAFANYKDVSFNLPSESERESLLKEKGFNRLEEFEGELLALKEKGLIREFLEKCVITKRNIIISGKTGSGKTTFARSLIEMVPTDERIITIEDVHELFLENHENKVHMLYGNATGRITADECLTACMRLSPDRIFLAELRGDEAWEYVNSLNTGHPGAITTTHANNALQTFERVATLVKKSGVGRQLDVDMIKQVLYTTVDVILYYEERQLKEVFYDPIFSKSKVM